MAEYKIEFVHPVYHAGERPARREMLAKQGLNEEVRTLTALQRIGLLPQVSEQITNQPLCYAQGPIFVLTSPLRNLPVVRRFGLPLEKAKAYRREREELARALIRREVEANGMHLDELMAARSEPALVGPHLPHGLYNGEGLTSCGGAVRWGPSPACAPTSSGTGPPRTSAAG